MLNFDYDISTKIIFGRKRLSLLPKEILKYSSRVLLLTGKGSIKKISLYKEMTDLLKEKNIEFHELSGIDPNPRLESVYEGIKMCRENNLDFILAAGGGSVIDCAKAIAAGACSDEDVWDFYLRKKSIKKALPIGTILTLSATGSEMNGNSVISKPDTKEKLSVKSSLLKPVFSILNPEYTFSVNKYQTAAGAVDIMSHVFEQYFSPSYGVDIQDRLAEAMLKTCIKYAPVAVNEPENYEARANLMWTGSLALNGLLTYGKITDWSTHLIEHEVSAFYDITHGAGLAILFPFWMDHVLNEENSEKFREYGENVWNIKGKNNLDTGRKAIIRTREFFKSLDMPCTLKEVGVKKDDLEKMAEAAVRFGPAGTFMKLDKQDVQSILLAAYE